MWGGNFLLFSELLMETVGACAFHHGRNSGGKTAIPSLPIGKEKQGGGDVLQVQQTACALVSFCVS